MFLKQDMVQIKWCDVRKFYKIGAIIGKGGYGEVRKAVHIRSRL